MKENRSRPEEPWLADVSELKADMTFNGVRYRRDAEGQTQWRVEAETARFFEKEQVLDLEVVTARFFAGGGGPILATASKATYNTATKTMTLSGTVRVRSRDGQTLSSESLNFNEAESLIWSEEAVEIEGKGLFFKGRGLKYDLRTGKLTVRNQTSTLSEDGELTL